MESPHPEQDFYRQAMDILDAAQVPFLVGGAFALSAYTGIVRDTKDFDLMVDAEDLPRALEAFRERKYRAEIVFSHWLAKVHHGEAFIDIIYSSGNGLCIVDKAWFDNARTGALLSREVRLCPPEEIIWQKAYIMERERFDGADVAHLLRSCGPSMDWPRLVKRFGADWPVLLTHLILFDFIYPSDQGAIPAEILQDLISRLPQERQPDRTCFGTFLSRAQYLPDIERWDYADPRVCGPRTSLTPEQCEAWTNAINTDPHRR